MKKYIDIYGTILNTYGFKLRPVGTFFLLQLRHAINAATKSMDHVFYPGFRDVPIDKPIFIIGNPRSGTTFMHRFLLETDEVAAFKMWEMLFPAISAHKMFGGLVSKMSGISPAKYHGSDAHETSLNDVETDDVASFISFLDGGFAWSYFHAWKDEWPSDKSRLFFDESVEPELKRRRFYEFMEGCWRRNMFVKGKSRFVAKSSLFTLRTKSLLERYPNAKFVYLVRDPLETIPSGMSLITNVLEKAYNMFETVRPELLQRYLRNLYRVSCHFYEEFYRVQSTNPLPEKNLRIVTYPQMMRNLQGTVDDLMDFLELPYHDGFKEKVRAQAEKQKKHKSKHAYSLEKYNLTEEQIKSDLAFVYDNYDVKMPA